MKRVKFLLEDGRKVYVSKRGEIDPYNDDELPTGKRLGAYTKQLGTYLSEGVIPLYPRDQIVKVIGVAIEDMNSTLDENAFILGGVKPKKGDK